MVDLHPDTEALIRARAAATGASEDDVVRDALAAAPVGAGRPASAPPSPGPETASAEPDWSALLRARMRVDPELAARWSDVIAMQARVAALPLRDSRSTLAIAAELWD
jgi:hypothetical protein